MLISRNEMYYFYGINHFIVKCIDIRDYLSVELLSRDYQFDTLFTIYFWCLHWIQSVYTDEEFIWLRGGKNENICFKNEICSHQAPKHIFQSISIHALIAPVCTIAKNSVGNKWILNLINMKSKLIHTHLKMSQQNETIIHYFI